MPILIRRNIKKWLQQIAENLDLDSLMYQRLDDLVDAIGLPKEKLCTHCWDGIKLFLRSGNRHKENN